MGRQSEDSSSAQGNRGCAIWEMSKRWVFSTHPFVLHTATKEQQKQAVKLTVTYQLLSTCGYLVCKQVLIFQRTDVEFLRNLSQKFFRLVLKLLHPHFACQLLNAFVCCLVLQGSIISIYWKF